MSYKKKLSQITTFIFDVDGVLTDGSVILENCIFRRCRQKCIYYQSKASVVLTFLWYQELTNGYEPGLPDVHCLQKTKPHCRQDHDDEVCQR